MSMAELIARAILAVVPAERREWAWAMAAEIAAVEGRGGLRFAIGCLGAAVALRAEWQGRRWMDRTDAATAACGLAAGGLGLAYLAMTGAPASMPVVNAAALAIGLALFAGARRPMAGAAGAVVVATALALLATALWGLAVEGAARWVRLGGVAVQPGLVLLPAAIVLHVARRSTATTAGMIVAAAALALQPDRGLAGPMLLALLAGGRRSGGVATGAAAIAFATTLWRPDDLPAVAWVDDVLASAPRAGLAAGAAVWLGTVVLLVPALLALRTRRPEAAAFAACWFGIVAAAALGNYPLPLVGYGGSAILGYFLAAGALRRTPLAAAAPQAEPVPAGPAADRLLRTA